MMMGGGVITIRTNRRSRRGGGFTTVASSFRDLLVVVVLLLQVSVKLTAAAKMEVANTMDDPSDMIEDFAREVMEQSIIHM